MNVHHIPRVALVHTFMPVATILQATRLSAGWTPSISFGYNLHLKTFLDLLSTLKSNK